MKYTLSHEWIQIQDNIAIVGISDFVRKEFGEIVYVELPWLCLLYTSPSPRD